MKVWPIYHIGCGALVCYSNKEKHPGDLLGYESFVSLHGERYRFSDLIDLRCERGHIVRRDDLFSRPQDGPIEKEW